MLKPSGSNSAVECLPSKQGVAGSNPVSRSIGANIPRETTMADQFDNTSRLAFVGAGKVGGAMALALSRSGYPVAAVASRSRSSAETLAALAPGSAVCDSPQEAADLSDVVFVTTPDDAIGPVASAIRWRPGQGVVHCSGAASLDVLDAAAAQGALPGALHPLQAVSSAQEGADSFPGTTFGIEGAPAMGEYLAQVARDVGGVPVFLNPQDKAMYHLSGVLMGNLLTSLGAVAAELWETFGFTREDGVRALAPMMRQVSTNLSASGLPDALAGPYVRGDVGTVRKHLDALSAHAPQYLPLYRELALACLPFAQERGPLDEATAQQIRNLLEQAEVPSPWG